MSAQGCKERGIPRQNHDCDHYILTKQDEGDGLQTTRQVEGGWQRNAMASEIMSEKEAIGGGAGRRGLYKKGRKDATQT